VIVNKKILREKAHQPMVPEKCIAKLKTTKLYWHLKSKEKGTINTEDLQKKPRFCWKK